MPFTQSTILSVAPPVPYGGQLLVSWTTSAPSGTWFQIYENDDLVWYGTATSAEIPLPTSIVRIDVGSVLTGEQTTNFAASLPDLPLRTVTLSWLGGTFESPEIAGFYIYGAATPGGQINYATPIGTVPAYTAGIVTDGYGYGGYGQGGFGESAASYSWTSGDLTSGVWTFAVAAFDSAGNVGSPTTISQTIQVPPQEPAPYGDGTRLRYTYNASTFEAVLTWNASPG